MVIEAKDHWWSNWPATFGYVCPLTFYPRSLADIVDSIKAIPEDQSVKAVGGGWSFTDAALPFRTQDDLDSVSIQRLGVNGVADLSNVIQGGSKQNPIDLFPEKVAQCVSAATQFDQASTLQIVDATDLDGPGRIVQFVQPKRNVALINIAGLASSLQQALPGILSRGARARKNVHYFHVEAGITMTDLQQLLDHQQPRLAIQATGGNPLATLAGSISTATHGGEFRWPLLVDRIRAVHLVGPGGVEWWIEGSVSIANQKSLQKLYPQLDAAHFIGGNWAGIPGLNAQDVLNAVAVSMGTMGVIYSVVLEVVPQYGIRQIVTPTTWSNVLATALTGTEDLAANDTAANLRILNVLIDGALNGTGVAANKNVYVDLAINPVTQECWITNRSLSSKLPVDALNPSASINDYVTGLYAALGRNSKDSLQLIGDYTIGRVMDFLDYATGVANWPSDVSEAAALVKFVTAFPSSTIGTALATVSAQAVANIKGRADTPDRGFQFIGDMLTGLLNVLQGTTNTQYEFGNLVEKNARFWVGEFSTGEGPSQILFLNQPDDHWWLGSIKGGLITWTFVATNTPFGIALENNYELWIGEFIANSGGQQLLVYDSNSGSWWLGTFNGTSLTWGINPATSDAQNPWGSPADLARMQMVSFPRQRSQFPNAVP